MVEVVEVVTANFMTAFVFDLIAFGKREENNIIVVLSRVYMHVHVHVHVG